MFFIQVLFCTACFAYNAKEVENFGKPDIDVMYPAGYEAFFIEDDDDDLEEDSAFAEMDDLDYSYEDEEETPQGFGIAIFDKDEVEMLIDAEFEGVNACSVCKTVVNYASNLASKYGASKVKSLVKDKVCAAKPGTFESVCDFVADKVIDWAFSELKKKVNANTLCKKIALC
ncbi:uncharacterized protein MONOS_12343 [Monocercomonoides exilis]|uniref:uncharacterized protein n=1 Tax=Monocercomonoides exilis TaxID=2049356 RepID=UPI003559E041|nr:hypothetical protein MONOS_12343 [Monocercomonoides exilis]|eukprot:MONOS_12343.1-p1 / transcript=MONOS_12343.1 / gene=MONOS_12343 / organism=Monocercomonoides_exilis_PA203 / gene_product=unspecified product / transcript_product=unspecified product / location=Mono_scaffold00678:22141-22656(+) / protein_length=172 / sequence_SO=supercontig / SO=protein_coding / is_pseudo=false